MVISSHILLSGQKAHYLLGSHINDGGGELNSTTPSTLSRKRDSRCSLGCPPTLCCMCVGYVCTRMPLSVEAPCWHQVSPITSTVYTETVLSQTLNPLFRLVWTASLLTGSVSWRCKHKPSLLPYMGSSNQSELWSSILHCKRFTLPATSPVYLPLLILLPRSPRWDYSGTSTMPDSLCNFKSVSSTHY